MASASSRAVIPAASSVSTHCPLLSTVTRPAAASTSSSLCATSTIPVPARATWVSTA